MSEPAGTRLAVLGSPIAHSKSPAIHRAAYAYLGLEWSYGAIEVSGDGLASFVKGLDDSWRGLSLTMPLKRDVLPLLTTRHSLVDRVGAANTVLFDGRGASRAVHGFNTDVRGSVEAIRSGGLDRLASAVILGSGATASSVLVALAELGAQHVVVRARTPDNAAGLVALGRQEGVEVTVRPWGSLLGAEHDEADAQVVVSTVPGGAADLEVAAGLAERAVLFDVAYEPWPTAMAETWAARGGTVVPGLELLLQQAIGQIRVFVAGSPDHALPSELGLLEVMRAAAG